MKLSTRLSKIFLKLAIKLDKQVVIYDTDVPIRPMSITSYERNNVDRIHVQKMVNNYYLHEYEHTFGDFEQMVVNEFAREIGNKILESYKGEIKKNYDPYNRENPDDTIYSLDIYVCKPTKKESC